MDSSQQQEGSGNNEINKNNNNNKESMQIIDKFLHFNENIISNMNTQQTNTAKNAFDAAVKMTPSNTTTTHNNNSNNHHAQDSHDNNNSNNNDSSNNSKNNNSNNITNTFVTPMQNHNESSNVNNRKNNNNNGGTGGNSSLLNGNDDNKEVELKEYHFRGGIKLLLPSGLSIDENFITNYKDAIITQLSKQGYRFDNLYPRNRNHASQSTSHSSRATGASQSRRSYGDSSHSRNRTSFRRFSPTSCSMSSFANDNKQKVDDLQHNLPYLKRQLSVSLEQKELIDAIKVAYKIEEAKRQIHSIIFSSSGMLIANGRYCNENRPRYPNVAQSNSWLASSHQNTNHNSNNSGNNNENDKDIDMTGSDSNNNEKKGLIGEKTFSQKQ